MTTSMSLSGCGGDTASPVVEHVLERLAIGNLRSPAGRCAELVGAGNLKGDVRGTQERGIDADLDLLPHRAQLQKHRHHVANAHRGCAADVVHLARWPFLR